MGGKKDEGQAAQDLSDVINQQQAGNPAFQHPWGAPAANDPNAQRATYEQAVRQQNEMLNSFRGVYDTLKEQRKQPAQLIDLSPVFNVLDALFQGNSTEAQVKQMAQQVNSMAPELRKIMSEMESYQRISLEDIQSARSHELIINAVSFVVGAGLGAFAAPAITSWVSGEEVASEVMVRLLGAAIGGAVGFGISKGVFYFSSTSATALERAYFEQVAHVEKKFGNLAK
jgi:hypothetical protein